MSPLLFTIASRLFTLLKEGVSALRHPLIFSNFGLLDPGQLVFGSSKIRQAFLLGPIMFDHGLMLTASTYAQEMTLAMGYCQESISQAIVERLMDEISFGLLLPDRMIGI